MRNTPIFGRMEDEDADGNLDDEENENGLKIEDDIHSIGKKDDIDLNVRTTAIDDNDDDDDDVVDEWNNFEENQNNRRNIDAYSDEQNHDIAATTNVIENAAIFEADFSQFNAFTNANVSVTSSDNKDNLANVFKDNYDLENKTSFDDNDDDFGDFEEATQSPLPTATHSVRNDDFNDDDFGEFSDFQHQQQESPNEPVDSAALPPPSNTSTPSSDYTQFNYQAIHTKLEPLLSRLFPVDQADADMEKGSSSEYQNSSDSQISRKEVFLTDVVQHLQDFENSNAIKHQWQTSVGKSSLVKALGIDSRNIVSTFFIKFVFVCVFIF